MAAITSGTAQSVAASNQVFHDLYTALGDKYSELQRDVASLAVGQANQLAKQNECCCNTLRAIDQVNFNVAMQAAETQKAIAAEGQATRAMYQQDKIEALQQQINGMGQQINTQRLEAAIAAATAGVVRYPDTFAYNAGNNPFCGCGNNYGPCNI